MHLTAKFYHPTFNRSEVIVRTNKQNDKQTPLKTSTSFRYATPVGNNVDIEETDIAMRHCDATQMQKRSSWL